MRFAVTRLAGLVLTFGLLVACSIMGDSLIVEGLSSGRDDHDEKKTKDKCADKPRHGHSANPRSGDPRASGKQADSDNAHATSGSGRGVPRGQIPPGDEDLYILKSEVVPPVCPACPSAAACPRPKPCPPCPPCGRCPEPAFDCKKVPNYRNNGNSYLPHPVLADFSQFGM